MTHASVFSGIGGPEVAATMLGWENLFHCEINPFGRAVLDYWYPNAKSYDDITKTDFTEWRGRVDVLTGGFPCQPFSYAGQRRGAEDDRYLWPYMFKCIDAIRPTWVVAENVGGILTMVEQGEVSEVGVQGSLFGEEDVVRGYELRETFTLERICDDLETHGYAVQPVLVPACAVGAPHRRDRVFIVGRRRDSEMDADERRNATNATSNGGGGNATSASGKAARQDGQPNEQPAIGSGLRDAERTTADTDSEGRSRGSASDGRQGTTDRWEGLSAVQREFERPRSGDAAAHAVGGGEGAPGEGGSVEGNWSEEFPRTAREGERCTSEWNSRFYELLRNAAGEFADTICKGLERKDEPRCGEGRERLCLRRDIAGYDRPFGGERCGGRWRNFPTVSPVHRGNDGLPFPLDDLTLSPAKWRTEALKAYGNAIVPQVMYEIFRAIEIAERRRLGGCCRNKR